MQQAAKVTAHPAPPPSLSPLPTQNTTSLPRPSPGEGKSAVVFGAASVLGGVSLVVVPLVSLGVDLTARASSIEGRPGRAAAPVWAFHLDEFTGQEQRHELRLYLQKVAAAGGCPGAAVLLICSPQALEQRSGWRPLVHSLLRSGAMRLVALDESDKVLSYGRAFRLEFAHLRANLFDAVRNCGHRVAVVAQTGTLPGDSPQRLQAALGLTFRHKLWGPMARREMCVTAQVKTQLARAAKAYLAPHLKWKGRKFIVFTNEAQRANSNIPDYCRKAMAKAGRRGDVLPLTGNSGTAWKTFVVDSFMGNFTEEEDTAEIVNCIGVAATAAANCGLSCKVVGSAVREGAPASAIDFAQELGRVARTAVPGLTTPAYNVILSLGTTAFMFKRIWLGTQGNLADRAAQARPRPRHPGF